MKLYFLLLTFSCSFAWGQPHVIPFASKGNTLALSVENTSSLNLTSVSVQVENTPTWLTFTSSKEIIAELTGRTERTAFFMFSIDKTAPVKKNQTLTFRISAPNGESWTKVIEISVAPPEKFELFQNYPNPFNPVTVIGYQLTVESDVSLKVYNLIGQEVTTLAEGDRTAGYHQETWNAASTASGMYVYLLIAKDAEGKTMMERKTMMLVK